MENFAHDNKRTERLGFPEVIFGQSKTVDDLAGILELFEKKKKNVLVTKLQKEKFLLLEPSFPGAFYEEKSGIFLLRKLPEKAPGKQVVILSGGTSDIHVVNEIYYSLGFMGIWPEKVLDVGVSGIHRLLDKIELLKKFSIIVAVAGFEGMLPTVAGGLLPQPIIAVPTDVGYGVARGGKTALNSMLASCANGITVVNINNGYGAAMAAIRILNLMHRSDE